MRNYKSNRELQNAKRYAQSALLGQYGFAPSLKDINVQKGWMEDDGTPQYVRFIVGGHGYQYDGITLERI